MPRLSLRNRKIEGRSPNEKKGTPDLELAIPLHYTELLPLYNHHLENCFECKIYCHWINIGIFGRITS
jgi:hypothetical protein